METIETIEITEEVHLGDAIGRSLGCVGNWHGGLAGKLHDGRFFVSNYISSWDKLAKVEFITEPQYEKIKWALAHIVKKDRLNYLCEEKLKPLFNIEYKEIEPYGANNKLMPWGKQWLAVKREIKKNGVYYAEKHKPVCDFSGPSWAHSTEYVHSASITITMK